MKDKKTLLVQDETCCESAIFYYTESKIGKQPLLQKAQSGGGSAWIRFKKFIF